MLTLNLCFQVKELDGTDSDVVAADILANFIGHSSDEDSKKWMNMSRELRDSKKLESQRRDLLDLEAKIKKSELRNYIKEQILDAVNEALNAPEQTKTQEENN